MPIDRDDGEIMGPRPHGKLPMGHRTRAVYDECLAELIGGYPGLEGFHERVRIDRALLVLAGDHAIDVQKLVRQPVRDARNVNLANSKGHPGAKASGKRSEEHTSELQSLMRISYAVFCLKKKNTETQLNTK